jgi:DNA invertase Pin-like site-specific DNA recombinase
LKDGDTLTVWKLDRLARSLRDLISIVEDFDKRGIHFRSLTEEINTATPGGKLTFHIFAALAEFERALIIERTREGMKAARARGVKSGPPSKLARQQIEHARQLIEQEGKRREKWPTSSKSPGPPFTGRLPKKRHLSDMSARRTLV